MGTRAERRPPGVRDFARAYEASISASAVLHPTATATIVRVQGARGGEVIVADGPYAETKEALMGFYLLEATDLDAAIAIAAPSTLPRGEVRWNCVPVLAGDDMAPEARRPAEPRAIYAETVRVEGARILATLVRTVGGLSVAEDAVVPGGLGRGAADWPADGRPRGAAGMAHGRRATQGDRHPASRNRSARARNARRSRCTT